MENIYLAGPMTGLTAKEVVRHIKIRKSQLKGFKIYHPMSGKSILLSSGGLKEKLKAHGYTNNITNNHHVIERDRWMVGQSDIVFADLSGAKKVSIGTCMELAWAYELRKYTVVVMEEGNVHEHCFIIEAADIIFRTVDDAIKYLNKLGKGEV